MVALTQMLAVNETNNSIKFPEYKEAVVLAANTEQKIAVPTDARYALFAGFSGNDIWVHYNATPGANTAAIPGASTSDGSAPECNPVLRFLGSGCVQLSIIALNACKGTICFFK